MIKTLDTLFKGSPQLLLEHPILNSYALRKTTDVDTFTLDSKEYFELANENK